MTAISSNRLKERSHNKGIHAYLYFINRLKERSYNKGIHVFLYFVLHKRETLCDVNKIIINALYKLCGTGLKGI